MSKIIERIVKSRLIDHLTSNKLLNPHQSAYCKHHSTVTALLYIHDHLIFGRYSFPVPQKIGSLGWLRCTVVFYRRIFSVLRSICSWRVTTYLGKTSAIGQPASLLGQLSLLSIRGR